MTRTRSAALALAALLPLAAAAAPPALPPLPLETFALPNGLTVTLAPDHRVPSVVVNTWFGVGSKDEVARRTGFAHLFEHLMFMGTARVPGNQFDVLMEQAGGANNASTSEDRTNYYSWGPASLLPTLLWLDADRLEALGAAMTKEKLDLQRDVVRNERRQSVENTPYGVAELIVPEAMYPPAHPYHHPVIGSHEDLEAATVPDVVGFFDAFYAPANASLVVAGDFDPAVVRPLVTRLFGAVPARPLAPPARVLPARLDGEVRRVAVDRVELPRLSLVWHSPATFQPGDAELDLLARVLGDGPSSRLVRKLVLELRLAESVDVAQDSRLLGSLFTVSVNAVPGADLERVKQVVLAELAAVAAAGPSAAELARARAATEVQIRQSREDLRHRADALNRYRFLLGTPDGFAADLARSGAVTPAGVRLAVRALGEGRLDLRILPQGKAGELPAARPADLPSPRLTMPAPDTFTLPSGLEVRAVRLPGSGLFTAAAVFPGAERAVPAGKAGATALLAALLESGAGGRSATAYAEALGALGGSLDASASGGALSVSVRGLSAHLGPTLDLMADALRRPNLAAADFDREKGLLLARLEARAQDPGQVASLVAGLRLFGPGDPRGRPPEGFAATAAALTLPDLKALLPSLLHPGAGTLLVAGDFEPAALRAAITRALGSWKPAAAAPPPAPAPLTAPRQGGLVLVDRPAAPQTTVLGVRLMPKRDRAARTGRELAAIALGGSFTSRLNQNLRERHGYTYGATAAVFDVGGQPRLQVRTSVQTEVTGPALLEIRAELDGLTATGVGAEEAVKARETARTELAGALATSSALVRALARAVAAGEPAGALADQVAALDAATTAAVDGAARTQNFAFEGLPIVLVGDKAKVLPQLQAAGLPAPQLVDAEGQPAP